MIPDIAFTLLLKNTTNTVLENVDVFCPERSESSAGTTLECIYPVNTTLQHIYDRSINPFHLGMIFVTCYNSRQLINTLNHRTKSDNVIIEWPIDMLHDNIQILSTSIAIEQKITLSNHSSLKLRRLLPEETVKFEFRFEEENKQYKIHTIPYSLLIKNNSEHLINDAVINVRDLFKQKESHWDKEGNLVFDNGIEISCDVVGVTYKDFLYQIANTPFTVDKTLSFNTISGRTEEWINLILSHSTKLPKLKKLVLVDEFFINLLPFLKVYNDEYRLDDTSAICINELYPGAELLLKLYPKQQHE